MAPFNLLLMVSSCNSALRHEIGHRAHASALATLCFPMQSEKAERLEIPVLKVSGVVTFQREEQQLCLGGILKTSGALVPFD